MVQIANSLPTLMFLAGCGLLTTILLLRWHRYFGRRSSRRANQSPIVHHPAPHDLWGDTPKDAAAHVELQKVELYDMARDAAGQLDSKMRLLEQLMTQSNEQIVRMEELLADLNKQAVARVSDS
jgi:hypothetical protein